MVYVTKSNHHIYINKLGFIKKIIKISYLDIKIDCITSKSRSKQTTLYYNNIIALLLVYKLCASHKKYFFYKLVREKTHRGFAVSLRNNKTEFNLLMAKRGQFIFYKN